MSTPMTADGAAGLAPVPLSRSTLLTIRRLVNAARDGWSVDDLVARAARAVALDARRLGLDAAHMLISLKRAWPAVTTAQRLGLEDAPALLSRLVSACIGAYFAGGRRAAGRAVAGSGGPARAASGVRGA